MKTKAQIVLAYSGLLLIGGLIGYLKAGSTTSLMAGTFSALVALFAGLSLWKNQIAGLLVAILLTAGLSFFFTYRFFLNYAFMPSGMMAVISFAVLALLCCSKKRKT